MDYHNNTREEVTSDLIAVPIPNFAAPRWKNYVQRSQMLLDKLAHHPAMAANLQQKWSTPANVGNKVYFQWDFVRHTLVSRCLGGLALSNLADLEFGPSSMMSTRAFKDFRSKRKRNGRMLRVGQSSPRC